MNDDDILFGDLLSNDPSEQVEQEAQVEEQQPEINQAKIDSIFNEEESNEDESNEKKEEQVEFNGFTEDQNINLILQSKGLDPNSILYEDENGKEVSVSFYELEPEEQLHLLNYSPSNVDLEEHELQTVNFLRQNNISLNDYAEYVRNETIKELQQGTTPLEIDSYSDDEIYASALQDQYPNLTEEEILLELEKAKENEELFAKKVDSIKNIYKENEIAYKEREQVEALEKENSVIQQAQQELVDSAINTKEFMGFSIDDKDRKEAFDAVFKKDVTGKSEFFKMLENPEKLFRIALFALKEEEINKTLEKEFKKMNNNSKPPIINNQPQTIPKVKINKPTSTSQNKRNHIHYNDELYNEMIK